jgi:hypothetical protein
MNSSCIYLYLRSPQHYIRDLATKTISTKAKYLKYNIQQLHFCQDKQSLYLTILDIYRKYFIIVNATKVNI